MTHPNDIKSAAGAYFFPSTDGGQPTATVPMPGPRSAQSPHGLRAAPAAPAVPGMQVPALRPRGEPWQGFEPNPVNTPEAAQQPPDGLTAYAATPWSALTGYELMRAPEDTGGFGPDPSMQRWQLPGQMPDIKSVDINAVPFGRFEAAPAPRWQPMMDPAANPWSAGSAGMQAMEDLSPGLPLRDKQDVSGFVGGLQVAWDEPDPAKTQILGGLDLPPRRASLLIGLVPARSRGAAPEAAQQPPDGPASSSERRKRVPRAKPSLKEHVDFLAEIKSKGEVSRYVRSDYSAFLAYLETGPCLPDGPKISTKTQFKALPLPNQNALVYAMTDGRKAQMIQAINRAEQRTENERLEPKHFGKSRVELRKPGPHWAPILTPEVFRRRHRT